jgi:riboflavin biosynthesis pyrimidine reductase
MYAACRKRNEGQMIPKLPFPIEKLRLVPLYQDTAELEKIRARSLTKAALSKVSLAYHDLYFPAPPEDRPYTFSSMVLSLDGKMAFQDNPQGPVVASANSIDREGGLTDFWILNVLRAHADAIIVGAKTLKSEPDVVFSCFDADLVAERKTNLGKKEENPLNVIVSMDGTDIPFDHSLFSVKDINALIATSHQGGQFLIQKYPDDALLIGPFNSNTEVNSDLIHDQIKSGFQNGKKVILMTGEVLPDAKVFLYILRKIGITNLLIESPTYTWLLMQQQMLDEFFLNYSSLFIGGPITPGYANGFSYLDHPHSKFLIIAMHQNSFLFTRQKVVYGLSTES